MVNDREEEELKKQLQQLELQNAEVAGDEDLSDSSDEGDDQARDPSVKRERPETKVGDDDDDDDEDAASTDGRSDAAAPSAAPAAGDPDGSRASAPAHKAKTSAKS